MGYREAIDAISAREAKAEVEGLDVAGRKIEIGDTIAYGVSLGRSSAVQIGEVVGFSKKGRPQIKIDERYRKSWGEKPIVTLQFFDRMVILQPVPKS